MVVIRGMYLFLFIDKIFSEKKDHLNKGFWIMSLDSKKGHSETIPGLIS